MDQGIIVTGVLLAFIVALLIIQQILKGKLESIDAELASKQKTAPKVEEKPLVSGKAITGAISNAAAQADAAVREAIEKAIAQVSGGKAKIVSIQKI